MPEMDGLTALPILLERCPGVVVLISSTLSRRGAETSMRALSLGAAECIAKPDGSGRIASAAEYRRELLELVIQLGGRARRRSAASTTLAPLLSQAQSTVSSIAAMRDTRIDTGRPSEARQPIPAVARPAIVRKAPQDAPKALRPFSTVPPRVLVLGSSTGGPQALVEVLTSAKEALLKVPVLIVQHMPPTFTALLAEQLGRATSLPSAEAQDGEVIVAGRIYVAPGGMHLQVSRDDSNVIARLRDTPPEHFCKPAVDPLFRSAAQVYGASCLGVVLTGMGSDGGLGAVAVSDAGGSVVIQDEESSVVWGMPGAVAAAGGCAAILPLTQIGSKLKDLLRGNIR
ncbi:chemotaxis-specific protein-glutamate methyltransferase CheB [Pseudochelatococcus sp. G4_1912]|uniref:chemotaxis-specific protein-glutamate methyltransferase CheB n=1 Tax=Pseudochelatococcus sp. G4_1912 TaxID=3114288 RepID=UPI0039C69D02